MDFLQEGLALGVDLLILGLCMREYVAYKRNIQNLKSAPQLPIDASLKDFVASQPNQKLPYAVLRGTVTPIGPPMRSVMAPSVTGVVQMLKLSEHCVQRGFAGFWTENKKLIHVATNEMPFELRNKEHAVEIIDALSAAVLDMDVIYDNYEQTSLTMLDHLVGFFSGVRQKGLQTTEEVLRDGSFITAIGELEFDGRALRMQRSGVGPLFLTTATKATLIRKLEEAKNSMLTKVFVCGGISIVIFGYIIRRFYIKKKQERDERIIRQRLEQERRERRCRSRPAVVAIEQSCVVCQLNPKEIIILPCGHVCICEDCSEKITATCPICRANIVTKAAAFIT